MRPASFAAAILWSAFLLFQLQPIASKTILPWFGGTASVWTICMLFFQALLFLGYAYAHVVSRYFPSLGQFAVHGAVLAGGAALVAWQGIAPQPGQLPAHPGNPATDILLVLFRTVGLPYFALAATSPFLQAWFSRLHPAREPYLLYAVSNVGSLAALLSYPVAIEPWMPLTVQSRIWGLGFVAFALANILLLGRSVVAAGRCPPAGAGGSDPMRPADGNARESAAAAGLSDAAQAALWFLLPMLSSVLLLAVTNQMCVDVASGPFLWILPLSIYLVTFIVTFTGRISVYQRSVFYLLTTACFCGMSVVIEQVAKVSPVVQIAVFSAALCCGCIALHGEMYRLRPEPGRLTAYYMLMSLGGAAGGTFVGIVSPLIFSDYHELPLVCVAILATVLACAGAEGRPVESRGRRLAAGGLALACVAAVVFAHGWRVANDTRHAALMRRTFFGVVKVVEAHDGRREDRQYRLIHGNTMHGLQFVDPAKSTAPTSYYSPGSGGGRVLRNFPRNAGSGGLRVAVVGLGVGTLAAYAQPDDEFTFFEIDPAVVEIARDSGYFSYLSQAADRGAKVSVITGDGRRSLAGQSTAGRDGSYDIIVLDAFSSDAIPVHLLTREAFDLYFRLLKKNGVIAAHVTNRNVDLAPVLLAVGKCFGQHCFFFANRADKTAGQSMSLWVALSNNATLVDRLYTGKVPVAADEELAEPWTDDFNNLWQLLIWRRPS
jgi:hypothetical protein